MSLSDAERESEAAQRWSDDVLDRKRFADYLSLSLVAQSGDNRGQLRGLTVSLDADWGAGKSFFITRWAEDLKAKNHPTVLFDAWENDIGDEASIALMASILNELASWKARAKLKPRALQEAARLASNAARTLRRAMLPTATVIAKGVVRKVTGVAIDELHAAVTDGRSSRTAAGQASDEADKVLDDLFEQKLREHASRKESIRRFRRELHVLIKWLEEKADIELPIFVFVDELDRCRPSYAIQLLEEVKHLFGIVDVVFVVSTNLRQLQHSVKSLYGVEFDGARYLKRLFDREYVLPPPDHSSFAALVVTDDCHLRKVKPRPWRPASKQEGDELIAAWSWIAEAFNLDLRSQKQVFRLADEVSKVLYVEHGVSCLWLFFLCVVAFKNKDLLGVIESGAPDERSFDTFLKEMGAGPSTISWTQWTTQGHSKVVKSASLAKVLWVYRRLSMLPREEVLSAYNAPHETYPESLVDDLFDELVNRRDAGGTLRDYLRMVKLAGFVTVL